MRTPNSKECAYGGYKLSSICTDEETQSYSVAMSIKLMVIAYQNNIKYVLTHH